MQNKASRRKKAKKMKGESEIIRKRQRRLGKRKLKNGGSGKKVKIRNVNFIFQCKIIIIINY